MLFYSYAELVIGLVAVFYCINISSCFTRTRQKDNVNILFLVFFRIDIFYLFHRSIIMFNFTYRFKLSKLCRL